MDTIIEQQAAIDEALVPHAQRLRIGRSNFRLLSDIKSKELALQLVYDVLRICPFFKAFLVPTDVPEIYMQEFWATATIHHHAIRFKMDNKKHIMNLESFRDILHICPRVHGQSFDEPPFEEEILAFIHFLRYNAAIRTLTDGLYHKRNVYYANLMWEDFVYQVEHKNHKKCNEMYYPRFTKVIIHHFMSKDPSIPRRNKVNWHYVRDDHMFSTIKLTHISQASGSGIDEGTGSILGVPDAPTDESEEELSWNSTDDEGADNKGKDGDDDEEDEGEEGDGNDDDDDQEVKRDDDKDDEEEGGDDEQEYDDEEYAKETRDEKNFDPIPKIPKNSKDEGNGDEDIGLNAGGEEGRNENEEEDELYRDVNINQRRGIPANLEVEDSHVTLTPVNPDGQQQSSSVSSQFVTSMLNLTLDVGIKSIFETTSQMDVPTSTSVAPLPMTAPAMTSSTIATITTTSQAPILPTTKIIKEKVKEQVKVQVSKILSRIEQTMNEQLEAEVFTRSSHSSKTSYAVAADLSKMELKKILIEKIKGNIKRSYGNYYQSAGMSTQGSQSRQALASESAFAEEPMQTTCQMEEPSYPEFDTGAEDQPDVNPEGQQYPHNLLKPLLLIPNNQGRCVIPFEHFINNDLEYLRGGASSRKYTTSITKTKAADYGHIKWIEDLVLRTMWIEEPIGYDKHAFWGNKDKKNRLMRIDELHEFSDGTLTDVRTALDDRLKGIRMQYLSQSIWRKSDKDKASAMIHVIDKRLKTRRIMRSLERFVGGRLYEGDFRMLQRTI
nr:hypothetical protein [Tanacetum cinerariifolium]